MKSSGSFAAESGGHQNIPESSEGQKQCSPENPNLGALVSSAATITTTQLEEIAEVDSEHGNWAFFLSLCTTF